MHHDHFYVSHFNLLVCTVTKRSGCDSASFGRIAAAVLATATILVFVGRVGAGRLGVGSLRSRMLGRVLLAVVFLVLFVGLILLCVL